MGRFLVKAKSETPLKLDDTCLLNFGDTQVHLSDLPILDQAGSLHYGLLIDTQLDSSDIREAMERGTAWADHVMNLLAFTHSVAVGPAEALIAFDYEPNSVDRMILQYEPVPTENRPTRRFKDPLFRTFWEALNGLPMDQRERIFRAIGWARKSMMDRYLLEKFVDCWTGMEVINQKLIQKHGLPDSFERVCKCGRITRVPWSRGIRYALERSGGGSLWKNLRGRRTALLHGFSPISTVLRDLDEPLDQGLSALVVSP